MKDRRSLKHSFLRVEWRNFSDLSEAKRKGVVMNATNDSSFDKDVLQSDLPVLVDFWAEWCGPCRALAPKLEEIAKEFAGKIKVLKVDIDQNPDTPAKYGIRGVPTLILFQDGKEVEQIVGNHPKEQISSMIRSHLS